MNADRPAPGDIAAAVAGLEEAVAALVKAHGEYAQAFDKLTKKTTTLVGLQTALAVVGHK